jgi:hypothetical protein
MSETEYVESLNAMVSGAGSNLGAAAASFEQIEDPTLEDFVRFVEQQLVYEYEVRDTFETFDPPESIEGLNQLMVDALVRILAVAEALVDAANDVSSLQELERTPEFADYQAVNADAASMCPEVQNAINDLATRPAIDNPWIADLRLTVRAFLDCDDALSG